MPPNACLESVNRVARLVSGIGAKRPGDRLQLGEAVTLLCSSYRTNVQSAASSLPMLAMPCDGALRKRKYGLPCYLQHPMCSFRYVAFLPVVKLAGTALTRDTVPHRHDDTCSRIRSAAAPAACCFPGVAAPAKTPRSFAVCGAGCTSSIVILPQTALDRNNG